MADENVQTGGDYGYQDDNVPQSFMNWGLNSGTATLKRFEWIPNGGKDGAEQEALDIVFNINGTDKSARMFPVTKAFKKGTNEEVTDRNAPEFKEALSNFNAMITHILHCYRTSEEIKKAMSVKIGSFKEFCKVAMGLLPTDYATKKLDIFLQWQWQVGEGKEKAYLELPKKMTYGKWVVAHIPGEWKEKRHANPTKEVGEALAYLNEKGEKHPFIRSGWFMDSNFAKRLGDTSTSSSGGYQGEQTSTDASATTTETPAAEPTHGAATAW
jgi:hypothetical protein